MSQKNILLGVNIDHVATSRQARGMRYPDLVPESREELTTEGGLAIAGLDVPCELNIGYAVIADAVFVGQKQSVKTYKQTMYEVRA